MKTPTWHSAIVPGAHLLYPSRLDNQTIQEAQIDDLHEKINACIETGKVWKCLGYVYQLQLTKQKFQWELPAERCASGGHLKDDPSCNCRKEMRMGDVKKKKDAPIPTTEMSRSMERFPALTLNCGKEECELVKPLHDHQYALQETQPFLVNNAGFFEKVFLAVRDERFGGLKQLSSNPRDYERFEYEDGTPLNPRRSDSFLPSDVFAEVNRVLTDWRKNKKWQEKGLQESFRTEDWQLGVGLSTLPRIVFTKTLKPPTDTYADSVFTKAKPFAFENIGRPVYGSDEWFTFDTQQNHLRQNRALLSVVLENPQLAYSAYQRAKHVNRTPGTGGGLRGNNFAISKAYREEKKTRKGPVFTRLKLTTKREEELRTEVLEEFKESGLKNEPGSPDLSDLVPNGHTSLNHFAPMLPPQEAFGPLALPYPHEKSYKPEFFGQGLPYLEPNRSLSKYNKYSVGPIPPFTCYLHQENNGVWKILRKVKLQGKWNQRTLYIGVANENTRLKGKGSKVSLINMHANEKAQIYQAIRFCTAQAASAFAKRDKEKAKWGKWMEWLSKRSALIESIVPLDPAFNRGRLNGLYQGGGWADDFADSSDITKKSSKVPPHFADKARADRVKAKARGADPNDDPNDQNSNTNLLRQPNELARFKETKDGEDEELTIVELQKAFDLSNEEEESQEKLQRKTHKRTAKGADQTALAEQGSKGESLSRQIEPCSCGECDDANTWRKWFERQRKKPIAKSNCAVEDCVCSKLG